MTMNSRLASAVHIMAYLARAGQTGSNSAAIAKSVNTNPVVVRRLVKLLASEGLVEIRRGRSGGVALGKATEEISLADIYRAIEWDDGVFSLRQKVNPRCSVAQGMETFLPAIFDSARAAVEASLKRTSLAKIMKMMS